MSRRWSWWLIPATVFAAIAIWAGGAQADGGVPLSLGRDGKLLAELTSRSSDEAHAVVVQPDGKIITVGWSAADRGAEFALARYTKAGNLDTSFGRGGQVLTDIGKKRSDAAYAAALQSDGKIVAAGYSGQFGGEDFAVVRYTKSGWLDKSFGSGGVVLTNLTDVDKAWAVAVQKDGKIVVAGDRERSGGALVRYTSSGKLDASFGRRGKVFTPLYPQALAVRSDGKIVVAGPSFDLVRFTSSGKLDGTFGSGGKAQADVRSGHSSSLAIQPDGKIVVAGVGSAQWHSPDFALVRYTTGGKPDVSFGQRGMVLTNFGHKRSDHARAVAVQPDGKIVAAGYSVDQTGEDFALVRYTKSGALDSGFGLAGKVLASLGAGGYDRALSVSVAPDGKIIASGYANADFALVRCTSNGMLDSTFGSGGKVLTDFAVSHR